jgi:aryl-alcohol dehydrogenase-like predicted oxidoreductase
MTFGEEWGWGSSKDESRKVFDAYAQAGGNFIDTANKYTQGTSEKYVGEFISSERGRFVVATKFTLSMTENDPNACGNHRKNIVQSLEASLRRLNTDYVDLYWLHAWDFMTPVEEVMRALDDLVRSGKVLYIGISDAPAWEVSRANMLAELRGWTQFVGLQIEYSLIERTVERDLIPMAHKLDIAVTPWSPLGRGILTGKYSRKGDKIEAPDSKRSEIMDKHLTDKKLLIAEEVKKVAGERGVTAPQVALNWVRQRPGLMIPIIGSRTEAQLKENLGCFNFTLSDNEMAQLDEISRVDLGFPHDFLSSDIIREVLFGKTFDQIDNHRI